VSGRHTTSETCVCAHAIYDTANLEATPVEGNGLLGYGYGCALLAAEDSKRWRMSMQRQTNANAALHVSLHNETMSRHCKNTTCTAISHDNYLDEHVKCTGYTYKNLQHRARTTLLSQLPLRKLAIHHSNALSLPLDHHHHTQARTNFLSVPSLPRPTRSRVVPSSRLVCTYIYKATECELAPLMSQISNVHPATLS
jgi:hypothetical protein